MEELSKNNDKKDDLQLYQNFVIFQTKDGKVNIDVFFKEETLWLTQKAISSLYEKDRSVISKHLKNIFNSGELDENMVCANFAHTTQHGAIVGKTQEKEVKFYNLRAIVAVGYRINSYRAIEFRKWATDILHEYIIKGIDGDMPKTEFNNMSIKWNGLDISIPDSAFSNLYEPHLCSDYLAVEAYIFKNKKLFIYVNASDGAGGYSVKFVFDKEKYLTRIITTNEMTNGYDFLDGTAKYDE